MLRSAVSQPGQHKNQGGSCVVLSVIFGAALGAKPKNPGAGKADLSDLMSMLVSRNILKYFLFSFLFYRYLVV